VVYICIQFQNRETNKEMFVSAMGGNPREKKEKKTKTQTRIHQTQLVEQSLGHKKKRNTNLFSYLLAKGWHLHGFHSCSPCVLRHTPTTQNPPICPP
jgi:hypothetical protein